MSKLLISWYISFYTMLHYFNLALFIYSPQKDMKKAKNTVNGLSKRYVALA